MIDSLDVASLEQFQLELVEAGFEPADAEQRIWVGPIAHSLKELTDVTTMKIVFFDGWPFQHPRLFVNNLDEQHVTASGDVCLWATGAPPGGWATLDLYLQRIDEWASHARSTFRPEDFALDAHRYFGRIRTGTLATVALESLGLSKEAGSRGKLTGSWGKDGRVLEIKRGSQGEIDGRWYTVGDLEVPPRDLGELRALLDAGQRANFDRRYRQVSAHCKPRLFLIAWNRDLGREALVLLAEKRADGTVSAEAIEVAPIDMTYLKLRAGPDAETMSQKEVVVFGAGAIGSNTALRLAEAGLGKLVVVDGERLRPSNVVRHAANSISVGDAKADAVRTLVHFSAPWTHVTPIIESPWSPSRVIELVHGADLVVEATGFAAFALLLAHLCRDSGTALVSVALYRGGAVGRIRRQAHENDTPLGDRTPPAYPTIPPADEPVTYEPGCSSPVNDASPVAVAAVAALGAEVALDTLCNRSAYPDESTDIYRPLEAPPFDQLGRVRR